MTAWVPSGDELTLGAVLGLADVVLVTVAAGVVTVDPTAVVVLVDGAGVAVVQSVVGAGPGDFVVWRGLLVGLEVAELLSLGLEAAELLSLGLEAAELLSLGLEVAEPLSDGLALVPAALSVALGGASGAVDTVGVADALVLAEVDVLGAVDAFVLAVAHAVLEGANPGMLFPPEVAAPGGPDPSPSVEPAPLVGPEPVISALICETPATTSCRVVGTTASTTPRTKTAMPVAKAGRSIASRQSRRPPGPDEPGPDVPRPDV